MNADSAKSVIGSNAFSTLTERSEMIEQPTRESEIPALGMEMMHQVQLLSPDGDIDSAADS